MGKIGQVMSLVGAKLRVSRLAFAFQRSDTHMAPPIRFLAFFAGVSEDDDEDPFAGLEEDEDELEENETVLDDC